MKYIRSYITYIPGKKHVAVNGLQCKFTGMSLWSEQRVWFGVLHFTKIQGGGGEGGKHSIYIRILWYDL
jgi:hypothetical protein